MYRNFYAFPWAGWKEVVWKNYVVDTACCKNFMFYSQHAVGIGDFP